MGTVAFSNLVLRADGTLTFTRGGPAVIFEVRAVLALVVLGAGAVVVRGQVEARCSVLTRVGRAVIDIQLGERVGRTVVNPIADIVSATLNRAKPAASFLQSVPGNNTHAAFGGKGEGKKKRKENEAET